MLVCFLLRLKRDKNVSHLQAISSIWRPLSPWGPLDFLSTCLGNDSLNIPGSYAIWLFTASDLAAITSHIHNWVLFLLWLHPFILSGVISPLISSSILGTYWPGEFLFHFAFSYRSWGSQGKNTEVVRHSLLQWTTFCHTSPPWPACLGWPHTAWLSFIELDKAVVLVWLDWLVFCDYGFSVSGLWCPCNTYHLTWVSLSLDVGYLFKAAPAKHSCCSLPWTRGISSQPPLLTLNVE